jgi:hypothetical protein
MFSIKVTACIDASREATWDVLSDLESISLWSEPVTLAKCDGDIKQGVGAERICHLGNNMVITERWISWVEGESYTYEGFNLPLVKSAKNTWSVKSENGKTLLTSESEITLKGGRVGKLLEPLMRFASNRIGSDSLSAFKFLVENGKPYEGKYSLLPRVSAVC